MVSSCFLFFFFFNDTATTEIYTLSLHDALPIETGGRGMRPFARALEAVAGKLARMLVADGEGASKLVTVTIRGAASRRDALAAARSVANSPLVKTAINGKDHYWGRIMMDL